MYSLGMVNSIQGKVRLLYCRCCVIMIGHMTTAHKEVEVSATIPPSVSTLFYITLLLLLLLCTIPFDNALYKRGVLKCADIGHGMSLKDIIFFTRSMAGKENNSKTISALWHCQRPQRCQRISRFTPIFTSVDIHCLNLFTAYCAYYYYYYYFQNYCPGSSIWDLGNLLLYF